MLQDSFSEQPDLPTSLLCFILFTGYLLSRGSNTNCLCFALRSFLIRLPSTFQNVFTFTLLPGSSALLQKLECSEYHPSEQSPVVSALSLTRLQLSGTNSLFLSAVLPLSALLNLPWKPFSFWKPFLQSHCPDCPNTRLVCVYIYICVCVCECACVCACIHVVCIEFWQRCIGRERVSA